MRRAAPTRARASSRDARPATATGRERRLGARPPRGHSRRRYAGFMVTICDVGPRDGLQNEPEVLEPATRAELVNRLAATGLRRVETVSFVRDDLVPQMAAAEEVAAAIEPREGVEYAGLVLADTIGVATPRRVRELVERVRPAGVHLHNTRNTGFANAYAALEGGVTLLDASVGGIGGCPFAPRATGNVATEDLVYMLEGDGVE